MAVIEDMYCGMRYAHRPVLIPGIGTATMSNYPYRRMIIQECRAAARVLETIRSTSQFTTTDMSQEAKPVDTYNGPRSTNEYNRLRLQHDFIKYAMGGQLVYAPVDLRKPSLRILDSATGDGYWLLDLMSSVDTSSVLVGADIAPQHFIPKEQFLQTFDLSVKTFLTHGHNSTRRTSTLFIRDSF